MIGSQSLKNPVPCKTCLVFQAWVQFGLPLDSCTPIVDRLLACVGEEELQETVMEALSSLISHPDTHKYPANLMEVLNRGAEYVAARQPGCQALFFWQALFMNKCIYFWLEQWSFTIL